MKWSLWYWLWKQVVSIALEVFFRRINVVGAENVPRNKAVLLAVNHQNAFVDALVTSVWMRRHTDYLVRADVFSNPLARAFLSSLNMMPIYRPRDKVDLLTANQKTFDRCYKRLAKKHSIVIFPEGTHGDRKRLRPIRKGVARIAFGAMEEHEGLEVQIVPVGIDYSDYYRQGSDLTVRYGKPMPLKEYFEQYQQNQAQAISSLRAALQHEMQQLMLHLPGEVNYAATLRLLRLHKWEGKKRDLEKEFHEAQKLAANALAWQGENPEGAADLKQHLSEFEATQLEYGLHDRQFNYGLSGGAVLWRSLLLILLAPYALFGAINNYLPWKLPTIITKAIIKDEQFMCSVALAGGLFLFPIFYALQTLLVWGLSGSLFLALIYLLALPGSGLLALRWRRLFKKVRGQIRLNRFRKSQPEAFTQYQETYLFLSEMVKKWKV